MNEIRKNVTSLKSNGGIYIESEKMAYYKVNGEETIYVFLPENGRPTISTEIVTESSEFVNGFKIVETANGEYGYVREDDDLLLPFRYDIAFDFNRFGLAMVGKDGRVSWINKNFYYVNLMGQMVDSEHGFFGGWTSISDFSRGDEPLSCLDFSLRNVKKTSYLDINGKIKEFSSYMNIVGKVGFVARDTFKDGLEFNEDGYALTDEYILLSKGFYINRHDFMKICMENEILNVLYQNIEKGKKLVKKKD